MSEGREGARVELIRNEAGQIYWKPSAPLDRMPLGVYVCEAAAVRCDNCRRYFAKWSCGEGKGTGECDCPPCQGYCECKKEGA